MVQPKSSPSAFKPKGALGRQASSCHRPVPLSEWRANGALQRAPTQSKHSIRLSPVAQPNPPQPSTKGNTSRCSGTRLPACPTVRMEGQTEHSSASRFNPTSRLSPVVRPKSPPAAFNHTRRTPRQHELTLGHQASNYPLPVPLSDWKDWRNAATDSLTH